MDQVGCARGGLIHHSRGGSERSQGTDSLSKGIPMLSKARVLRTHIRQPRRRRRGGRSVSREPPCAAGTHASSDLKRSSGAHDETGLTRTRVDADGRLRTLETAFGRKNTRRTAAEAAGGGWLVWGEAPTQLGPPVIRNNRSGQRAVARVTGAGRECRRSRTRGAVWPVQARAG